MSATLERIKAEADAQPGLVAQWSEKGASRWLVIWRRDGDDVLLQVEHTPLGLRYTTYECTWGARIPEHWSDTTGHALPQRVQTFYWWTYRHLWGWLTIHRWRGLPEALSRLDVTILRWEHQQQALEQEVSHV
jgi:hypothetical protein